MIYRHQWKDHVSVYNHTDRGFCKLTEFEMRGKKVACLHDLVVYPAYRRRGHGMFLLAWAIGCAALDHCENLILWPDGDTWVEQWYIRLGFVASDAFQSEDGEPCLILNLPR